jgi:peptidoglycan/LPS O-acetylase OafA/YrhL
MVAESVAVHGDGLGSTGKQAKAASSAGTSMTGVSAVGDANRYEHIDSLRGIAALLVVWLHVTEVFNRLPAVRENGNWLYRIAEAIDVGRIGVVIFFAISGFVICSSLKGPAMTSSIDFAIKRLFRLFPAYWLAIPLGAWASWYLWGRELSAGLVLANLSMLPSVFGYKNMMGLLWTLETELVFYVMCLLLFWLRLLGNALALAATCGALLMLYGCYQLHILPRPSSFVWLHMPYHLSIMFWGGIVRIYHDNRLADASFAGRKIAVAWLAATVAATILIPLMIIALKHGYATGKTRELTLAFAYLIGMSLFLLGAFIIRLRQRFFVWLGMISYSLYLFHGIFFTPMYWWARHNQQHSLSQLHMGVYLVVTCIVSIGFAYLVYRLVEKPCNGFARQLVARRSRSYGNQPHA